MTSSLLIIWLDVNANDRVSSFRTKLMADQNQSVKIFTDSNSCVAFIRAQVNKTIFFILSGSVGAKVMPLVYHLDHVRQIFIFCGSIAAHMSWAIDYTDKTLMFDHEDDLFQRLFSEIEEYLRQQAEQYLKQANVYKDRSHQFKQGSCG